MEEINKTLESFRSLRPDDQKYVLLELMDEGTLDISEAVRLYAKHLENFKRDAKHDIYKLSEAGILLAEKEIKKIPAIKSEQKRNLSLAQAKTLFAGGGYVDTPYRQELLSNLDFSQLNDEWYEQCWALKTKPTAPPNPKQENEL